EPSQHTDTASPPSPHPGPPPPPPYRRPPPAPPLSVPRLGRFAHRRCNAAAPFRIPLPPTVRAPQTSPAWLAPSGYTLFHGGTLGKHRQNETWRGRRQLY